MHYIIVELPSAHPVPSPANQIRGSHLLCCVTRLFFVFSKQRLFTSTVCGQCISPTLCKNEDNMIFGVCRSLKCYSAMFIVDHGAIETQKTL